MLTNKVVFFSAVSDEFYHPCRTGDFIKSFNHFHPDIELKIFRDAEIKEIFAKDERLNFYNCKASFSQYVEADLKVWIDVDHLILGRMDSVLANDYDVACPANYNLYQNASLINLDEDLYLQGGIIASANKEFWNRYEELSLKYAMTQTHKDNDVLNAIFANESKYFKFKYLDGANRFDRPEFKEFYGCSSLNQEDKIIVNNNRIELNEKPVIAYHFAKGDKNKPHPRSLFSNEVINWINENLNLNY